MQISKYYSNAEWQKVKELATSTETPFLAVDLSIVRRKYEELRTCFPMAHIHYAVKANPGLPILELLRDLGSSFDIASVQELDRLLSLGIEPSRISYGNTIKKEADIRYAWEKGVRLFATDSKADVQALARSAPGSKIFVRVLVDGSATAAWPLSRKFGCHPDMAVTLLVLAQQLGLEPHGLSFHVGSQQSDIASWDTALANVKYIFDWMRLEEDIQLKMINMGGGFPANYISEVNPIETYAREILRYLHDDYGDDLPELIIEPGRSLVGAAGVLVSDVVLVSRKSRTDLTRWVYLDVGLFRGLIETVGESIKYPLYTEKMEGNPEMGTVVLAGPTCDSMDIMYQDYPYQLPQDLAAGDKLYWLTTGAYTSSYSSVEFNGFPPLKTVFVD